MQNREFLRPETFSAICNIESNDKVDEYWMSEDNFLENKTTPYMTTSFELGMDATVYNGVFYQKDSTPFSLMIHSPFELPTMDNQKFYYSDMSDDIFFITPQLHTIDDSMIGMKPHE